MWAEAGEIAAARQSLDRLDREYPQSHRAGALAAADRVYLRWLLADRRRPAEELQALWTGVGADLGRLAESLADEVGRSYAHFLCAHLLEEQGAMEEALRHYRQVDHLSFRFMGRPESLVQQAHCLESLGRSPEVIAVTQEFLASFAGHAWGAPARHLLYQAQHYYEPLRAWAEEAEKTGSTPEEISPGPGRCVSDCSPGRCLRTCVKTCCTSEPCSPWFRIDRMKPCRRCVLCALRGRGLRRTSRDKSWKVCAAIRSLRRGSLLRGRERTRQPLRSALWCRLWIAR
jgi:hypothetical protein